MFSAHDYAMMARAIQLAWRGRYTTHPNPRVGCVLSTRDQIIGEGWHVRAGEPHAEINALRDAESALSDSGNSRVTAYVTLEPCCHHGRTPPCSQALIDAGIRQVVVATLDPNPLVAGQGVHQLRAQGIDVKTGLLESQALALNPGFFSRMQRGRPWVRVKLAMSLDGKTAMANGQSQWITGAAAREDGHRLRAQASAVMTGSQTLLTDDPQLTVRLPGTVLSTQDTIRPRIIIDSRLQTPIDARLFKTSGPVWLFTHPSQMINKKTWTSGTIPELIPIDCDDETGQLSLPAVMTELGHRQINELHVEAGQGLAGALLKYQLVDELVIYTASKLMGHHAMSLVHLPVEQMNESVELKFKDIRQLGHDIRIVCQPDYSV